MSRRTIHINIVYNMLMLRETRGNIRAHAYVFRKPPKWGDTITPISLIYQKHKIDPIIYILLNRFIVDP